MERVFWWPDHEKSLILFVGKFNEVSQEIQNEIFHLKLEENY
jgi:hypothetical protein